LWWATHFEAIEIWQYYHCLKSELWTWTPLPIWLFVDITWWVWKNGFICQVGCVCSFSYLGDQPWTARDKVIHIFSCLWRLTLHVGLKWLRSSDKLAAAYGLQLCIGQSPSKYSGTLQLWFCNVFQRKNNKFWK